MPPKRMSTSPCGVVPTRQAEGASLPTHCSISTAVASCSVGCLMTKARTYTHAHTGLMLQQVSAATVLKSGNVCSESGVESTNHDRWGLLFPQTTERGMAKEQATTYHWVMVGQKQALV